MLCKSESLESRRNEEKENPLIPHIISMVKSANEDQLRIIYRFVLTLTKNNRK